MASAAVSLHKEDVKTIVASYAELVDAILMMESALETVQMHDTIPSHFNKTLADIKRDATELSDVLLKHRSPPSLHIQLNTLVVMYVRMDQLHLAFAHHSLHTGKENGAPASILEGIASDIARYERLAHIASKQPPCRFIPPKRS